MASAAPPRVKHVKLDVAQIGTSKYEQWSAMLSSILLLLGMITLVMFIVWLTATIKWGTPPVQLVLEDVGGGGKGSTATGGDKDLEEPNPEEMPEIVEQKVDQSLESISSVVATEAVTLDAVGGQTSLGNGEGTGTGDGRGPGPGGPGTSDGIPAWERWEVRFNAQDIKTYASQLDFFKVELAVVGGGIPDVDYCSNLSGTPTKRKGLPKDEKRLRFLNKAGDMREADRTLAGKAGIQTSDRIVFQFYSEEMYNQLLTLENIKFQAAKKRIIEVKKTIFGIRGTPGKWEFYIIDQQYRPPVPYAKTK
jgi:hypothetical protein